MMRCLFAHGFEGSNQGPKPAFLRDTLGWHVTSPRMYDNGWTLSGHTTTLLRELSADENLTWLVGSSFGGLAAVAAAHQLRNRPLRLILLAPAFGFGQLMAHRLGEDAMGEWRRAGYLDYLHRGLGHSVKLPYQLWQEAMASQALQVRHPCVIIHGRRDDVIPISHSRDLLSRSPSVIRLLEVDDGHRLSNSFETISEAVRLFDGRGAET